MWLISPRDVLLVPLPGPLCVLELANNSCGESVSRSSDWQPSVVRPECFVGPLDSGVVRREWSWVELTGVLQVAKLQRTKHFDEPGLSFHLRQGDPELTDSLSIRCHSTGYHSGHFTVGWSRRGEAHSQFQQRLFLHAEESSSYPIIGEFPLIKLLGKDLVQARSAVSDPLGKLPPTSTHG